MQPFEGFSGHAVRSEVSAMAGTYQIREVEAGKAAGRNGTVAPVDRWVPTAIAFIVLLVGLGTMTSWLMVPAIAVMVFEVVRWQLRVRSRMHAAAADAP